MKKTRIKELFNCIKKTKVTLVSIVVFIMTSIAIYFGFAWAVDTIINSTEEYFEDVSYRNVEVKLTYGIDDDLIENILDIPEVSVVEPTYMAYRDFNLYDKQCISRINSITNNVDKISIVEGKLPEKENELAIIDSFAKKNDIEVGTRISFIENKKSAIIKHILDKDLQKIAEDEYVSELIKDDFVITATIKSPEYLTKDEERWGFNDNSFPIDCVFYAPKVSFNLDAYSGYSSLLVKFNNLDGLRMNTEEYDSREQFVIDKIKVVSKKYGESRYRKLIANAKLLEDELKGNIESIENVLIDANDKMKYNNFDLYNEEEIINTKNITNEAIIESSYNRKNLSSFVDFVDKLKEYEAYCHNRKYNIGYFTLFHSYDSFEKLKFSLSLLFTIVGVLISFCAFSKLIYEDSIRIGLKKALGFYKNEIASFYFLYDFSCCILGIISGALVARFIIEPILISAFKKHFFFNNIKFTFSFLELFAFGLIIIFIQTLTVFISCKNILGKNAHDLIINKIETKNIKHFYEKNFIYKTLPLFTKAIIKNFFTDRRRIISTIINIFGCTTLIISALSLKSFIENSFFIQFNKIYDFDTIIYVDENFSSVQSKLDKLGVDYAQMNSMGWYIDTPNSRHISILVDVFPDSKYDKYISLYNNNKKMSLNDGLWLSSAYWHYYNVKKGDIIKLTDEKGIEYSVPVEGFFDYYLSPNQIFINKNYYEDIFEREYKTNALILNTKHLDKDILFKQIKHIDGFKIFQDYYKRSQLLIDSTSSIINAYCITYIVLSFLVSILSLLTLFNMFINEKKNELVILIINGYTRKEAKKYIYRDTIFLTFISLILGMILGVVMSNISIMKLQHENMYYVSGVDIYAIIIGFVLSSIFVAAMCITSLRTVDKLQLSDINKS